MATRRLEPSEPLAKVVLVAITLLALGLRVFRIDAQSAWVDEAFTIHASAAGWNEMLDMLVRDFSHPPLHPVLVRWWFALVDVGTAQARMLSAVFGTLAVPALYSLGRRLFDRRTALLAAFLLTISQLGIIYSQEARSYSLLLLLVIVSTDAFVRAFRSGRTGDFALFLLAAGLLLYTHYYGVVVLAAHVIYATVFRRRSSIPGLWWAAAAGVIIVAYLPWLTSGVIHSAMTNPANAVSGGTFANLLSPIYALNWFNNGKLAGIREQAPWWTFPVGCILFTAPALILVGTLRDRSKDERAAMTLLGLSVVVPLFAVASLGFMHVIYDVRHVSFAVAPYYLLVARGLTTITSDAMRRMLFVAITGYSTLSFRADYFIPYKENYRDALTVIVTESRPGDCTIFGAPDGNSYAPMYWTAYYHNQRPPTPIPLDQAASRPECRRVWLVWDRTFWKAGPLTADDVRQRLGHTYRLQSERSFLDVDTSLFVRSE